MRDGRRQPGQHLHAAQLASTASHNPHRPQRCPSRVHSGNDCQPATPAPRHPFRDRFYTTRYNLYAIVDVYRDASSAPALVAVSTGPYYPYAGPRTRYIVSTFSCPASQRISFAVGEPASADRCLYYFDDIIPVPFELHISRC
ncbi:hypothetical protein DL762_004915 [Monosporascus cannonballus]|uniref:Ubiquitin 3 binding protein But2 C-terminal domain-containing protein n=1 Tax=Monosporascus cannonballus TaxID=155416 RepID=A0ABY0H6P3_9PEZI|nr:hypothetical protein DL762_004915 [Monosporascus cannonballus]